MMEYAVRGLLVQTAEKMEQDLNAGRLEDASFDKIIYCNIGNPQALDDVSITFLRQVLAGTMYPPLLEEEGLFPSDVVERARKITSSAKVGAYSHSMGIPYVRQAVADFIEARDGHAAHPESIFLTDGASPGISTVIYSLIRSPADGVMLPVPQYPLYSATVTAAGGSQVDYFLDEENNWALDVEELDRSLRDAQQMQGVWPRALAVINPGNPTGQVMTEDNMKDIVQFCADNRLILLADEVYQENIYDPDNFPFVSFKKVAMESVPYVRDNLEMFSFHSISKGMLGECGLRGGYMEAYNISRDGMDQLYKNVSVNLCSNTIGQVAVELMVNPPKQGDPSFDLFHKQYYGQFESLKRRAARLVDALNTLDGVSSNPASGALYAFPSITLPEGVISKAAELGIEPDTFYCLELLKATGVCVVPGNGFGQAEGTYHFRTTFLPPEREIESVIDSMRAWHNDFIASHGGI